jgi:hypothetical protein
LFVLFLFFMFDVRDAPSRMDSLDKHILLS